MNCNQRRSNILKATAAAVCKGKRSFEQFARTSRNPAEADTSFLLGDNKRPFLPAGSRLFPSELAEIGDRKVVGKRIEAEGSVLHDSVDGKRPDDVAVEILGLPDTEGVRADPDQQASECSSSFGYTDGFEASELQSDNAEVQSSLRDGNGALPPALDDRRRRVLNMDWKNYRRGIEWRCRWLDLRLMELQSQDTKYEQILSKAKSWDSRKESDGGAARAAPVPPEQSAQPLLHRHRRRKVEQTVDISDYMSKHPLFQRYEKKKREDQPDSQAQVLTEVGKSEQVNAEEVTGGEDSVEKYMLMLETLQARVIRLRNQLRGSMSHKLPTQQLARQGGHRAATPKSTARPTRTFTGAVSAAPAATKGTQAARRRSSDYDINNVVMPVSVGIKYVEHVKHANIDTPQWRVVGKSELLDLDEDSSDEDTDDEAYKNRHAPLEARERSNRYVPRSNKRTFEDAKSNKGSKISGSQMPRCSISSQYSE